MLVHVGKHFVRTRAGFAADFCPVCREVVPFGIAVVRNVTHINYIEIGKGAFLHHEATCTQCGITLAFPQLPYSALVPLNPGDAFELAEHTHAHLAETRAEEFDLQRRAAESPDDPGVRVSLIARSIGAYDYTASLRKQSGAVRSSALVTVLAAVPFILVASFFWGVPGFGWLPRIASAVPVLAVLGLAVRLFAGWDRWWARKYLIPRLRRALTHLHPTPNELHDAFASLRQRGSQIAHVVDERDVVAAFAPASPAA